MAGRTNIKIKNLSTVTGAISKMGNVVQMGVQDEIMRSTSNIEFEAQTAASKISGDLSIDKLISQKGLTGVVSARHYANADLAAYIEFGTGVHAAHLLQLYPQEVRDLAMQYYVNGKGRLFSQPYLIPAFLKHRRIFLLNIKKVLRKAVK